MTLQNEVAIVTGAGSGIGRATALRLAADGAHVVAADIAKAQATVDEIAAAGGSAIAFELDVTDSAGWSALVSAATEAFGAPTRLANIAGIVSPGPDTPLEQTEEAWARILDVNLKSAWLGMRAVLPGMLAARAGSIVNIASEAAVIGIPGLLAYSATKTGVVGITRSAAIEHAGDGITINAVAPGFIKTPIQDGLTQEAIDAMVAGIPSRRIGQPSDIAGAIAFLFGADATYITGQVLAVDGGWGIS